MVQLGGCLLLNDREDPPLQTSMQRPGMDNYYSRYDSLK